MQESIKVPDELCELSIFPIQVKVQRNGVEAVEVRLVLGRQLLGITANVFVPTTILNIISFSTNYYKDDYFESIIAINLTSMLVLVALTVQVIHFILNF